MSLCAQVSPEFIVYYPMRSAILIRLWKQLLFKATKSFILHIKHYYFSFLPAVEETGGDSWKYSLRVSKNAHTMK